MRSWIRAAAAALPLCLAALAAPAMSFDKFIDKDGDVWILAKGNIAPGDDEKLHRFVAAMPPQTRIWALTLESGGGNLAEAAKLSSTVRSSSLVTIVLPGKVCASACFLVFAAGPKRMASADSWIGVHSASDNGQDTFTAQAFTTLMARDAAEYGVPAAVVGKLVTTPPSGMTWLMVSDLRSMNVTLLTSDSGSTYRAGSPLAPGTAEARSTPQVPSYAVPQTPPYASPVTAAAPSTDMAFQDGRRSREAWEGWFGAISGDTKAGAAWWAENRSKAQRDKLSCSNQGFAPEVVLGCAQAQARLGPADVRRRSDPEYKAGWNSL